MLYRFEIALYALVCFLPYLVLDLFAFRQSLRFSPRATALLVGLLSLVQIGLALWLAPQAEPAAISQLGTLLGGLFLLGAVNDQLGKTLFTLLMIASDANLILGVTDCIAVWLLPGLALRPWHWSYCAAMVCVQAVTLSPMFVYLRKVCAQSFDEKRRLQAWNFLWLIPLLFNIIWLFLFQFKSIFFARPAVVFQFLFVMLMLCLGSILVYILVWQLIKEHVENETLREKEYMLTMQHTQYEHLQERIEEARRAKHDLRHHLHVAHAYLSDGKLDELRAYLNQFSEAIPDDSFRYCEHYTVNVLLNYFAWQAKLAQIQCTVSVQLPEDVGIPDDALTVVLGNLLENAIHACKEERRIPPTITIYGRRDETAVFFQITNTCTQPLRKDPFGRYPSTKPEGMGIGLSSVDHIARQYDGLMEIQQTGDRVTAAVMLTIPE